MTVNTDLDRPIVGDISQTSTSYVEQKDAGEFLELLDDLLAFEEIDSVRWDQYTPYFNDGDPCEFSTTEVRVRLTSHTKDDDGDYGDGYHTALYNWGKVTTYKDQPKDYNSTEYRKWRTLMYSDENKTYFIEGARGVAIADALTALGSEMGAFDIVLKANFGDHARVTATREGFDIEYYEHD